MPHRHLLKKLEASGVRGEEHEWLRTYLTCRTQRVVVDGRASQEVPVLSGVPQGTVLGPLMFLTYINDINRNISGTIKLFADDALLFRQIRSDADCLSLQKDLDTLYSWARKWRMQFNASKCHVLQITRKKSIITVAEWVRALALNEWRPDILPGRVRLPLRATLSSELWQIR